MFIMCLYIKDIDNYVLTYQPASKMHAGCDWKTPGVTKPLNWWVVDGLNQNVQQTNKVIQNKLPIEFILSEEASKQNSHQYKVIVKINHKEWGMGSGNNKKEAEQAASKETIELIGA